MPLPFFAFPERDMNNLEEERAEICNRTSFFPSSVLAKAKDLDSSAQQMPIFWAFFFPPQARLI